MGVVSLGEHDGVRRSDVSNPSAPNAYGAIVRSQLPRLLGLLDRTPASPTYGCFDRNYWHLKLVTDFPGATYQQAVLALVWLATQARGDVVGPDRGQVVEWARAAMRFWTRIQNRDGSFNEWYAQEHSYCPTAFTTFAISEALLLLSDQLPTDDKFTVISAVERAGRWLAREHNAWVANQNMAALNALLNVWLVTAKEEFCRAAERKLGSVLEAQNPEGWFPEYDGADPGYSLVATDLLAHYWMKTRDDRVYEALGRLLEFLSWFIQPDGSVADCGSRATQHALPYGLELMAHAGQATADRILSGLHLAIANGQGLTPDRVDDRYFAYFYINSYVGAFHACSGGHGQWKGAKKGSIVYPNAGLGVFSRGSRTAVISLKRNNMLRVFVDQTLVYADAGYQVGLARGRQGMSCGFDPKQTWSTASGQDGSVVVRTSGRFFGSSPTMWLVIPLKIWAHLMLSSGTVATWFNTWLKSREVAFPRRLPVILERDVRIEETAITVTDRVILQARIRVTGLSPIEQGCVTHSPSAGFYTGAPVQRLIDHLKVSALTESLVSRGKVTVIKTLSLDEKKETTLQVEWR